MDKVIWGTSQAITSALFFLIQLSFLKSSDLHQMALFSSLFGLMNFFLLAVRRSLIETNPFKTDVPGIVFFLTISFGFLLIGLIISILIPADFSIILCATLFLFDQLVLDFLRFSESKNHYLYISVQGVSLVLSVLLVILGFGATSIILFVALLQLVVCVRCMMRDERLRLDLQASMALVSMTRVLDFFISSGFGFILPLVTFIFLDAISVGSLRTSQNFLSLGSVFAAAFYYSALERENDRKMSKFVYFLPSLILSGILTFMALLASPTILKQIFGPYFFESLPLSFLLIIALVPTIWASTIYAALVKMKAYSSILKIHLLSLPFLAIGSSVGFRYFGVKSFGFFSIFCALLELLLAFRIFRALRA